MQHTKNDDVFYEKLKKQLADTSSWPSEYLYKFIIPSSSEKTAQIEAYFDGMDALIRIRDSKKGTYTALSVSVVMASPDAVIEKYKVIAENIEGVISL